MKELTNDQKDVMWAEIDECLEVIETRLPGDIDVNQMTEHFGKSYDYARTQMLKLAATGKWHYIIVYDPVIKNRRNVLRKIE